MNTFASRVLSSREWTFRFVIGNGTATFQCTASSQEKAWVTIMKEQKALLKYTTAITLIA